LLKFCFLDTETRARVDISAGMDLYSRDAEVRIVTYARSALFAAPTAWHDEPVQIWEPWQDVVVPNDLRAMIVDPESIFVAHNAVFDRLVMARSLKIQIPLSRWRCAREMAYSHGLPGSMEILGVAAGLPADDQKRSQDKHLIDLFCSPQGNGKFLEPWEAPEQWAQFCTYAKQDTHTLREIFKRLPTTNYGYV
jgi:DNA polymerase